MKEFMKQICYAMVILFMFTMAFYTCESRAYAQRKIEWIMDIGSIEFSIKHLIKKGIYRADYKEDYIEHLALEFQSAGYKFDLPPLLLVSTGYRESVFDRSAIGKRGEKGIMQVSKFGIRKCKLYCGSMITTKEQIECGACWLDIGRNSCKSLEKGLKAYVGSGECNPSSEGVIRAFRVKYDLWQRLRGLVLDGG